MFENMLKFTSFITIFSVQKFAGHPDQTITIHLVRKKDFMEKVFETLCQLF